MRITASSILVAALSAAYLSPACAQRQRKKPITPDGALSAVDAHADQNAMIETLGPAINRTDVNPPSKAPPPPAAGGGPPAEEVMIPITALLFAGPAGPKQCRGSPMLSIPLSRPVSTTPTCYNTPKTANCATFTAMKTDGCQARVFAESDCKTFTNLAVFMPELRTVGGLIRSVEVTCGVKSVEPAPLNMGALGAGAKKPKPKPGSN